MVWTKTKMVVIGLVAVFLAAGIILPSLAKTKMRAARAERMKMWWAMKSVQQKLTPALIKYAKAHDDDLPITLADLQEYLPANSGIDDDHWQLLASGKLTPQLSQKDVVLIRQRNVPRGKLQMVGYTDGHFTYKKQG